MLSTEGGNRNWRDCTLCVNTKPHSQCKQQTAVTSLEFVLDNDLIFPFPGQEHGTCERGFFLFILSLGGQKGRRLGAKTVWSNSSLSATPVLTAPVWFQKYDHRVNKPSFTAIVCIAKNYNPTHLHDCSSLSELFSHWVQNHNANHAKGPLPTPACNPHTTHISITFISYSRPKQESWAGSTRCCPQKGKILIQLFLPFTITLFVFHSILLATCFIICHVRLIKRVQKQCLLLTFSHIIQH